MVSQKKVLMEVVVMTLAAKSQVAILYEKKSHTYYASVIVLIVSKTSVSTPD